MSWLRFGIAVGVLALAGAGAAQESAPEEDEARKREPAKVYTNEDLARTRGRISVVGTPATPSPAPEPESGSDDGSAAGEDGESEEESWRRRGREHRRAVAEAEQRLARLQAEVEELDSEIDHIMGAAAGPLMGQLQRAEEARDRAAAELAEAQTAFRELQRAARRAGIPPGWLRE